ncbi:MAG: hypothetical protein ABIY51_10560, partial [Ferruginibacter sp.]
AEFSITHTGTFGDVAYFNNTAGGSSITTGTGNNKLNMTSGNTGIGIPSGLTENPTLGKLVVRGTVGATVAVFDDNAAGISLQSNLPGVGFNEYYNAGSKFLSTGFAGKLALSTSNGDLGWYASNASGVADGAMTINQRFGVSREGSMFVQGLDNGYIFKDRTTTNYGGWNLYANAGKASLYRYTLGGNTITVDSTGALGLQGITDITAPLTMNNAIGNKIDFYYGSPTSRYGIGLQGGLLQMYAGSSSNDIAFGYGSSSAFTENMRIKGSGNVGIKIAAPSATLHVARGTAVGGTAEFDGTNYTSHFNYSSTEDSYIRGGKPGAKVVINDQSAGDVLISQGGGNVGIGTIPIYKLDVAGRMRLKADANSAGVWFSNTANTADVSFLGQYTDSKFGIYGAGGWKLAIDNNDGTVYCGSTNLDAEVLTNAVGYKLKVFGKIISEEVRVQLKAAWPDYVFNEGYKKLTLPQLEVYLKENKHLPNIPSASEIEKDGQHLGEVQRKMLEKVEELSLYIIELKKEIDALKMKVYETTK